MSIIQMLLTTGEPPPISNYTDFNNLTVIGTTYKIKSPGSPTSITATVNNAPNGSKGIDLGSFSFTGTSFVSNNQNQLLNRTLASATYDNLRFVSEVFQGGRLVWTALSGVSEGGFDFYSITASFGCVAAGAERSGSTNAVYEQTVNNHSFSNLNSTFTLRYRTDGSVNGGRGWNDNSGNLWFSI
jgi:hypothetical protein